MPQDGSTVFSPRSTETSSCTSRATRTPVPTCARHGVRPSTCSGRHASPTKGVQRPAVAPRENPCPRLAQAQPAGANPKTSRTISTDG